MTDPDTNYATNAVIAALCYKNQTTPGDNTIDADELLALKNYIDGIINEPNNWTSNYSGHASYSFFQKTFIRLFKAHLKGEDLELTEDEEFKVTTRFGTIPFVCSNPDDDYEDPSSV